MPPRRAAIEKITETLLGGPVMWTYGEVRDQPLRVNSFVARNAERTLLDQTAWDETEDVATQAWEKVVNSIDWTRVLLTASGHHLDLQQQDSSHKDHILLDEICAECVQWALLTKER